MIVCRDLLSQQFTTVPDVLLVHSITEVVIVDSLISYLGKDMEDCILLASRETICCNLLLPRDMNQVIVPWQHSLLDPDDTRIVN